MAREPGKLGSRREWERRPYDLLPTVCEVRVVDEHEMFRILRDRGPPQK
jgi:hypothetical protein